MGRVYLLLLTTIVVVGCSSGNNSGDVSILSPGVSDSDISVTSDLLSSLPTEFPAQSETATYRVAIFNDWGVEDFPQDFPDDAHLSAIGGATHNEAVSFYEFGDVASDGIQSIAELGINDAFIENDVRAGIQAGTVDSAIVHPERTGPRIDGRSGMKRSWPLFTFATKLAPSPDWFVGLTGMPLYQTDTGWRDQIQTTLPLMDGGSRSAITPVNGGPNVVPAGPISFVFYDSATGTYVTGERPSFVARLAMTRIQ